MAFSLTAEQIIDGTKTVTRRVGWNFLKSGDRIKAVRKSRGLKRGESLEVLRILEIISVSPEPLSAISQQEVRSEGFPDMTVAQFIDMFCATHANCTADTEVTRIEFIFLKT
ncbi:MAG: hypothetical protein JWM78_1004 [Verrucomicrobiaceae bacterium]|nr:hypothetical protein [Verrucomicrobiaceae bacterium]